MFHNACNSFFLLLIHDLDVKDEIMLKHTDVSKRILMLQLTHVLNVIVSRGQFNSNVTIHPCSNVTASRAAC